MPNLLLGVSLVLTVTAAWQNKFYAFTFGCSALVVIAILISTDRIVRTIKDAATVDALRHERVGLQVATALNAGAHRYGKRGA